MTDDIRQAILAANAIDAEPDWDPEQGRSGVKVLALLGNLAKCALTDPSRCYVEIGVYRGLTLGAVARSVPGRSVFGVDDFSYDEDGGNERRTLDHLSRVGSTNATLIKDDYERALPELDRYIGSKRVGLYLVDGPHDYRSQLMCLLLMRKWLTDDAVVVVDDCNYDHVRLATRDFLAIDPSFSLMMQAYTPRHPERSSPADLEAARRGWWNGIHVLARMGSGAPRTSLSVPVGDARKKCEEEHTLHSNRFFSELPALARFAESALHGSRLGYAKGAFALRENLRANKSLRALERDANTYSLGLKPFEIA